MQSHKAKHVYAHLLNKSQIDSLATSQHTREAGTAGTWCNGLDICGLSASAPGTNNSEGFKADWSTQVHSTGWMPKRFSQDVPCLCSSLPLKKVSAIGVALTKHLFWCCGSTLKTLQNVNRLKSCHLFIDWLRFCPPHDVWLWFKGHPEPVRPRPPFRSSRQWFGDLVATFLPCYVSKGCEVRSSTISSLTGMAW